MPQVKNRAKVPKEAVRVQAKAVNHQVAKAEENPLEAAAKAANHQVVEKAVNLVQAKALEKVKEKVLAQAKAKAVNLVQVKAKATETEMVKAMEKAKHPRTMEHQVKMQEMISKMLQKRLLKPLMVLANAVRVQTQKAKRNVKPQNNQKKMLRMP